MIIDVLKMQQEGKNGQQFNFEYEAPSNLILSLPNATILSPVLVNAYIELDGKDVYADVDISYKIECDCSRCLEKASETVNFSYSAKYSLFKEEDCYLYKSGKVDLAQSVNEAIIVSQPTVVYCKKDCKGLCPVCGANLNEGDCGHNN